MVKRNIWFPQYASRPMREGLRAVARNDDRRPMSEFGKMLFDLGDELVRLPKPVITDPIKRISGRVKS